MLPETLPHQRLNITRTLSLNVQILRTLAKNFPALTLAIIFAQILSVVLNLCTAVVVMLFIQKAVGGENAEQPIWEVLGSSLQNTLQSLTILHLILMLFAFSLAFATSNFASKFLVFLATRHLENRLYNGALRAVSALDINSHNKLGEEFSTASDIGLALRQDLRMYVLSARLLTNSLSAYLFLTIVVIFSLWAKPSLFFASFGFLIIVSPIILLFVKKALQHSESFNELSLDMNAAKRSLLQSALSYPSATNFNADLDSETSDSGRIGRFLKTFEFRFQLLNFMDFFIKSLICIYICAVLAVSVIYKDRFTVNYLLFIAIAPFAFSSLSSIIMSNVSVGRLAAQSLRFQRLKDRLETPEKTPSNFENPAFINAYQDLELRSKDQDPLHFCWGILLRSDLLRSDIYLLVQIVNAYRGGSNSAGVSFDVISDSSSITSHTDPKKRVRALIDLINESKAGIVFVKASLIEPQDAEVFWQEMGTLKKTLAFYASNTRPSIIRHKEKMKALIVLSKAALLLPSEFASSTPKELFGMVKKSETIEINDDELESF